MYFKRENEWHYEVTISKWNVVLYKTRRLKRKYVSISNHHTSDLTLVVRPFLFITFHMILNTVRSRYIAFIFSLYNSRKTLHSSPVQRVMVCRSWMQIWSKFYHRNCCTVCTIISYKTAIYRECLVIFGYITQYSCVVWNEICCILSQSEGLFLVSVVRSVVQ